MKISEKRLNQVIKESINKVLAEAEWTEVHGSVGEPYSKKQAAIIKLPLATCGFLSATFNLQLATFHLQLVT